MKPCVKYGVLAVLVSVIVILDQVTKHAIDISMHLYQSIPIIEGLFHLTYIRNPGAAFGIMADGSGAFRFAFFLITSIVALVLLGLIFVRLPKDDWYGHLSVAAIVGGAIGNLIDRVRYGEVIDFLDVFVQGHHWPAFNVADSAISVGVVALILNFSFGSLSATLPSDSKRAPAKE
ncbi:MAG TPA: signal peptidase II [Nitrospirales bacterium]|nr:signal peptidase II [Nitrospirales bacterium]HIN33423.1 signal peptidase II [Nitrospirales bacterium]